MSEIVEEPFPANKKESASPIRLLTAMISSITWNRPACRRSSGSWIGMSFSQPRRSFHISGLVMPSNGGSRIIDPRSASYSSKRLLSVEVHRLDLGEELDRALAHLAE